MIDELNLLDTKVYVTPCISAQIQLKAAGPNRGFSLSRLSGNPGHCVWCEKKLEGKRTRWCSDACVDTAQSYCYPQTPGAKMHRLIFIQGFACTYCGQSHEDEIRMRIVKQFEFNNKYRREKGGDPVLVSLHQLGYNTGHKWQTDHIVPISQGGKGICPTNLQVICTPCHAIKTSGEQRGR